MPKIVIIIFGPPGSGKGTQAEMLSKKTDWKKISTGDLLRAEIAAGTELGKSAGKLVKAGKLVPDKITISLVEKSLKGKTPGFIFDGFPRNKKQLSEILAIFKKILKKNDKIRALEIAVSDDETKRRIGQRKICSCGKVYHLSYNAPINSGICDVCGGKLFTRNDDKPKVIADRLKNYHHDCEPLLDYWKKQGKLVKIDGEQAIKKVHEEIVEKLKESGIII
ncbi:MAG: nucleoside monophosphate kinase [bacterium]